jgi:integrase
VLTETKIKALRARAKPYKVADGHGLYLWVTSTGSRLWRVRFRYPANGPENVLGLGAYPVVTLKRAREQLLEHRRTLADGRNPGAEKKARKLAGRAVAGETFAAVAAEWFARQAKVLAPSTLEHAKARFESYLALYVGAVPVAELTAPMLLQALRRVEARGVLETARRVRELASRILRYAVVTGRCQHDVAADLRGAVATPVATHFASITDPAEVGKLLRAVDGYVGQPSVCYALRLLPYVFTRPGELRGARWSEFDLEGQAPQWRIAAARMKMGREHLVPLARQVVALLKELRQINGEGDLLFPGLLSAQQPISDMALNGALRRLGYSGDVMTSHGFRSTASTLLNETGYHPDLIELQLAHAERNKVRSAYNKAQRLAERRAMMQAWADYLDGLRAGGNVVPIRRPA